MSDTKLNFDRNEKHVLACEIVMLIPGVFHLDVVFELAGRLWTVVDTCLVTVSATPTDPAQITDNSTDL